MINKKSAAILLVISTCLYGCGIIPSSVSKPQAVTIVPILDLIATEDANSHAAKQVLFLKEATRSAKAHTVSSDNSKLPLGNGYLFSSGMAPVPSSIFVGKNQWFTKTDNHLFIVVAGGKRIDAQGHFQGAVFVYHLDEQTNTVLKNQTFDLFVSPISTDLFSIIDASGSVLKLKSESGTEIFFDAVNLIYKNSY